MATYYAWTEIRNGGEVEDVELPTGAIRTVVTKRNVAKAGEKITKKGLGLSDEEWERMVESGCIREYPFPEGTDDYTSPATAAMRKYLTPQGDIDINVLLELGLANPAVVTNPPAEEAAEVPSGA